MSKQRQNLLFRDKLIDDDRLPFWTLEMPNNNGQQVLLGVLAPKLQFWIDLVLLLVIQTIFMCLFAAMIYKFVVPHRKSVGAFILGYGVIIPLAMLLPYQILEYFQIANRTLKMSVCTVANVVVFRCIEAMHGTSPECVETSMGNYVTYYSSLPEFVWDTKTNRRVKIMRRQLLTNIWRIVLHFIAGSLVLSYLLAYDVKPFPSDVVLNEFHLTPELLYPGQLANNYLAGVLTFFTLSVGFNLVALAQNAQGYLTQDVFRNPLFSSSCPTDFWGRKWNLIIHRQLKRGAFLPVKHYFPSPIAVLACFVASGMLHDYTWTLIFYQDRRTIEAGCLNCFFPILFKQTAFFLYCGVTMLLERPIGRRLQWLVQRLPLPIASTLVVMTALPVSHWYTGDWIVGGYFDHFALGVFKVVKI